MASKGELSGGQVPLVIEDEEERVGGFASRIRGRRRKAARVRPEGPRGSRPGFRGGCYFGLSPVAAFRGAVHRQTFAPRHLSVPGNAVRHATRLRAALPLVAKFNVAV
jgi:hypothetical protein